jgi:zinc protease
VPQANRFHRRAGLALGALFLMTSAARAASIRSLPNGLRYVVLEDHAAPVVSLQIYVRCGGVNEQGPLAGVSHFLEHMVFKGTAKVSAGEISRVVESNGGSINAATGMEMTNYYIDMPSDLFDKAFDVLAESVVNPTFPPVEFEKERGVILEEIRRRNDDPQSPLWDNFLEALYRRTPYRNNVIGSEKTIREMTRDMMVGQHQKFYVPSNMVVVVAGDVKSSLAVKRIKDFFGKLPKVPAPAQPSLFEPPSDDPVVRTITRPAKQAHVALGFTGPVLSDRSQVAMDTLAVVLGGGQGSRLYQSLREQKGLVWSVGSSFITHAGSGVLGIFAECPPERARGLENEVYLLLYEAESDGFAAEELERAKAQMRASWLFGQETYHGQASQWGFYSTLGRPGLMKTYLSDLDQVTVQDLRELLKTYFGSRRLSGSIVVPSQN